MSLVKILLIGLLIFFVGFIGWMNLTPGHFQYEKVSCACEDNEIKYLRNKDVVLAHEGILCTDMYCSPNLQEKMLLQIANLDFNK
jgi:hypothetical protein